MFHNDKMCNQSRQNNYKHILPKNWAQNYMKQKPTELKKQTILIVRDFNILFLIIDRTTRRKIKKDMGLEQHSKPTRPHRYI